MNYCKSSVPIYYKFYNLLRPSPIAVAPRSPI